MSVGQRDSDDAILVRLYAARTGAQAIEAVGDAKFDRPEVTGTYGSCVYGYWPACARRFQSVVFHTTSARFSTPSESSVQVDIGLYIRELGMVDRDSSKVVFGAVVLHLATALFSGRMTYKLGRFMQCMCKTFDEYGDCGERVICEADWEDQISSTRNHVVSDAPPLARTSAGNRSQRVPAPQCETTEYSAVYMVGRRMYTSGYAMLRRVTVLRLFENSCLEFHVSSSSSEHAAWTRLPSASAATRTRQ
ncbi:hypothetical protein BV25DRAFT_1842987 [Artomyces pyxidatus]|uniref:Uncharacterized protein n=1 Tax=Artomyces pyxidatus TaxID=48021 RepID=A0ACB8SI82_9AGAM|nr:hypothetical protein BV25DRAFT_1842987 [Artomyces pyxidatus]